jgi:hypothetical protein
MATSSDGLGNERTGDPLTHLDRDIRDLRQDARRIVSEISARISHTLDLRAQVREHVGLEVGAGILVALVGLVGVGWRVRAHRRERRVASRIARKAAALRQALAGGEEGGRPDWGRILTAALVPVVGVVAKALARRYVDRPLLPG